MKNKLSLGYQYLGEHTVKNIAEPIRVYKVLMEPDAVGKVFGERSLAPNWQRTAIAVVVALLVAAGVLVI